MKLMVCIMASGDEQLVSGVSSKPSAGRRPGWPQIALFVAQSELAARKQLPVCIPVSQL